MNNNGLQMYINSAENYVRTQGLITFPDKPTKPLYTELTYLVNDTIEPRVTVKWGQRLPEGYFCPNKIAGCAQTALAQIMSAFELPKKIDLTYEGRDAASQPLNWTELKSHVRSISDSVAIDNHLGTCPLSLYSHLPLARLCRQLGHMNNANYMVDGTGVSITCAQQTAKTLLGTNLSVGGISEVSAHNAYSLFQNMKMDEGVLYMRGSDVNRRDKNGNPLGHVWILDGGLQVGSYTVRTYTTGIGIDGSGPKTVTTYNLTTLFHFNWGWNGAGNGYFLPDVYMPRDSEKQDSWLDGYYLNDNYNNDVKFFAVRRYSK